MWNAWPATGIHTYSTKLGGWRGRRYNDLLSADRRHFAFWPLAPAEICRGEEGVSTAAGLCSVVTCELKAKSLLFLGWCQWTETDTVIDICVWNIPFRPSKVWSSVTYRTLWGRRRRKYVRAPWGQKTTEPSLGLCEEITLHELYTEPM